ncbi:MAG: hypothetical protein BWX88_00775 [Planctomycetes bacterium ADurb.Bin126]|nr:MAG: hypothetical protein BWX88_00775 [Planctomycetes bacterium ADurb.Bin126]HOD82055.1 hypothetical protein [Phycisphaerae bacterium]HQL72158.1 hypothetical protein [Phycisphaerae bacterium]
MGLFLSMSGVVGGTEDSVIDALRTYAECNGGSLEDKQLTTEEDGCLVISKGIGGVTVLYPGDFFDWETVSQFLSERLAKAVFSFHIHDGDLWMYSLYEDGEVVDQFNPVPDYWQELEGEERDSWRGNPTAVAQRVPGLAPEEISRYLVRWDDEALKSPLRKKAYPTDKFAYGEDWQLVDFMGKLGLDYPVDDRGMPHGLTYLFKCESEETS